MRLPCSGAMAMAPRYRGAEPPRDFIKNTHLARGRAAQKQYDWLRPCETLLQIKEREGPLQKGQLPFMRPSKSYPGLPLPPMVEDWQRQEGAARAGAPKTTAKVHRPKPYTTEIWPVGSQGPRWRPLSPGEKAHRHNAGCAVQAVAAMQMGKAPARNLSRPGPRARRRAADPGFVEPTPGIEAWDSVSQALSSPRSYHEELPGRDGLPPPGAQGGYYQLRVPGASEVMSAETFPTTQCSMALVGQDDRDIARHLARNRRGWYDHLGGRLLG